MKISEFPKLGGENVNVGQQIKEYITRAGILQKDLAKKAGITDAKLSLAMNGKRRLTFDEYARICWALGVNTDRFITPTAPENRTA